MSDEDKRTLEEYLAGLYRKSDAPTLTSADLKNLSEMYPSGYWRDEQALIGQCKKLFKEKFGFDLKVQLDWTKPKFSKDKQALKKQLLEAFVELDHKHLKLGASENAVFRYFIWWCSNELVVCTNYSTIASHSFISKRTAINAVKKLEEAGVLLVLHKPTDGKHEFMKYKINPEMNPKLKRQQQRTRRTEQQHNQSKFKANPTYRGQWPNQKRSLYDKFD